MNKPAPPLSPAQLKARLRGLDHHVSGLHIALNTGRYAVARECAGELMGMLTAVSAILTEACREIEMSHGEG